MTAPGKVTVTIDDARIKERVRGLSAQAWDEGYSARDFDELVIPHDLETVNPYRAEAQA